MATYLLTCPECKHPTRVRFIRKGAMATCTLCQHQYRVDGSTLAVDAGEGEVQSARTERPFELLRDRLSAEGGAPAPTMEVSKASTAELAAAQMDNIAPPPPPRSAIAPAASAAARARLSDRRARRQSRHGKLVAVSVVCALALVAVLVALILSGPVEPPPGGTIVPGAAPIPVSTPDPLPTPPDPVPPDPDPPAGRPTLALREMAAAAVFVPIDPPVAPMAQPAVTPSTQWTVALLRGSDGPPRVLALFVQSTQEVYGSGSLRVQLLDADRRAIAELSTDVPLVCAAQGVQLVMGVPAGLAGRVRGVAARFDPADPVPGGLAIEIAQAGAERIAGDDSGFRLRLSAHNPHAVTVRDPIVVIERADDTGQVVYRWRGELAGSIAPGGSMEFETVVAGSGRLSSLAVRACAVRSP